MEAEYQAAGFFLAKGKDCQAFVSIYFHLKIVSHIYTIARGNKVNLPGKFELKDDK